MLRHSVAVASKQLSININLQVLVESRQRQSARHSAVKGQKNCWNRLCLVARAHVGSRRTGTSWFRIASLASLPVSVITGVYSPSIHPPGRVQAKLDNRQTRHYTGDQTPNPGNNIERHTLSYRISFHTPMLPYFCMYHTIQYTMPRSYYASIPYSTPSHAIPHCDQENLGSSRAGDK